MINILFINTLKPSIFKFIAVSFRDRERERDRRREIERDSSGSCSILGLCPRFLKFSIGLKS